MKSINQYIIESLQNIDIEKIIKKLEQLKYIKSDDDREIAAPAGNRYYMKRNDTIIFTKGDGINIFEISSENNEYILKKTDDNGFETILYKESNLSKFVNKLS